MRKRLQYTLCKKKKRRTNISFECVKCSLVRVLNHFVRILRLYQAKCFYKSRSDTQAYRPLWWQTYIETVKDEFAANYLKVNAGRTITRANQKCYSSESASLIIRILSPYLCSILVCNRFLATNLQILLKVFTLIGHVILFKPQKQFNTKRFNSLLLSLLSTDNESFLRNITRWVGRTHLRIRNWHGRCVDTAVKLVCNRTCDVTSRHERWRRLYFTL